MFGILAVFHGRNALGFPEDLREITKGRETQQLGDLGQGKVCFRQKVFAFVDASGDHIIDGGYAVLLFESVREVEFVHVRFFRQLIQG